MVGTAIHNLLFGFSVVLQPENLMWSFFGVLIGNIVGVLPGMGVLTTISILLPLTYAIAPVPAILLLGGIFYGSQYGGAICSILLNLPCHAPHAVTCIDGYPMTLAGKGGTALGVTMLGAFFGAAFGITVMIFLSPLVVQLALQFGPAEYFTVLLFGLLAGSTLSRGDPLKGVCMTVFGMLLGTVGADATSGVYRFSFGMVELTTGIELVALAMGLFGIVQFLKTVNNIAEAGRMRPHVRVRDMFPHWSDLKQAFRPMIRGTLIGGIFGLLPGTGPTIASFVSYAAEKRISKTPERFGYGAIEGVAAPETSTHSCVQLAFIPTMTLGIPGEAVMALLLSGLLIKGITPGPQLIGEHPDIFWGLVASFWIGNILLVVMNVPLIGLWVKLLAVPYRYLYPTALFFICIGVWSTENTMFVVGETLVFGIVGYILTVLEFEFAPILLGVVMEPLVEDNFRRALIISRGDMMTFIGSPISATFAALSVLLLVFQAVSWALPRRGRKEKEVVTSGTSLQPNAKQPG